MYLCCIDTLTTVLQWSGVGYGTTVLYVSVMYLQTYHSVVMVRGGVGYNSTVCRRPVLGSVHYGHFYHTTVHGPS